jgi:hypothetical protein
MRVMREEKREREGGPCGSAPSASRRPEGYSIFALLLSERR